MKKAISVLLAVIISVSQLALCAEAATNPLQASDRITQQLAETTARKQEIEASRIQRDNMKDAALTYGASSKDTNNLGFILNRKTMTKQEYEAFKWSFILSQFAVPLEDSLLDVFSQSIFNEMISSNFNVSAVANAMQYGGANPDYEQVMASMIQDTNFNDIVETIKSNYSLLYLYKENDSPLVLADLLYGSSAINERFYVYDTILATADGSTADQLNALYYKQERLADTSTLPGYNITSQRIPVAIYDASFYFYLQLAVGTYCLKNSTSVLELEAIYGQAQIVIDSYGNICVYTSEGAKIVMPNFGNSIFINEEASGTDALGTTYLAGKIDLYNKWVTTLYTRTSRTHVGAVTEKSDIFGEFSPIAVGGNSKITYTDTTLESTETQQSIGGQYINELVVKDGSGDLSNTMILVDPADIVAYYGYGMADYLGTKLKDTKGSHVFSPVHNSSDVQYPIQNRMTNIYLDAANELHSTFFISEDENQRSVRSIWDTMWNNWPERSVEMAYNVTYGTIYSNLSSVSSTNTFTHSLSTSATEASVNPYPIINVDVNLAAMDIKSASGKSHYYRAGLSLLKGSWRYSVGDEGSRKEVVLYSGSNNNNSSQNYLQVINNCLVMVTTFKSDQLVRDLRFVSDRAAKQDNGNEYAEIYLPMNVINIGQNCSAFVGEEKGMFVARHQDYFSSDMTTFRKQSMDYFDNIKSTAVNSWGGGVYEFAKLNYSAEYSDAGGTIELQSTKQNSVSFAFPWSKANTLYGKGLSVAISIPSAKDTPYLSDWEPETVKINKTEYKDYSALADYLDSIYRALGAKETTMYFSTSLCCGGNDDSDKNKDIHVNSDTMREGVKGTDAKLIVKRSADSDNNATSWSLTLQVYTGNKRKSVTVPVTLKKTEVTYKVDDEEFTSYYWMLVSLASPTDDQPNLLVSMLPDGNDQKETAARLINIINFMAVCGKAYMRLADTADQSIASFKAELKSYCAPYKFDANELLYALAMLQSGAIEDSNDNAARDIYYFDEYQYLLRSTSTVSGVPGSQNGLDFASIMYYWDRAYLPELTFNKRATQLTSYELGINSDGSVRSGSAYARWLDYQEFLQSTGTTKVQYSFKKYLEDNFTDNGLDIPFCQELLLQLKTLEDYIEQNSTIQQYFDPQTQAYNYLDPDTIILYPVLEETDSTTLRVYAGLADGIASVNDARYATDDTRDALASSFVLGYAPLQTIMALQCNTDYEHNYLVASPAKAAEVQHVSKEELMDKANTFFDNPVSSLSYIFAGFIYKAHTAVATGSLGSVFSANWLVESSIYKWIMARYVAIVTIVIVVLLFLKLTQFAMSKTRDYGSIGRSIVGILAMCMVPLLVFNSFIWAFNATSQWALAGPTNKMLLSEVNTNVLDRVNNDPGVTAEFNAFREQFDSLQGEYDELTFEEIADYSLDGPVYRQVPLSSYMLYLQFGTDKKTWYSGEGFLPVQIDHYNESMFYYFYDYIKAEFYNYVTTHASQNMPSSTYISILDTEREQLNTTPKGNDRQKDAWVKITSAEAGLAAQTGEFIDMLNDTDYVYSLSINPQLSARYGGAYAKDLAGVYNLFDTKVNKDYTTAIDTTQPIDQALNAIKNSAWRKSMNDAKIMAVDDAIIPKLWTDVTVVEDYLAEQNNKGGNRGGAHVVTSRLDLFNSNINTESYYLDARVDDLTLTPLEEKLCSVTTAIYEDTLKALEYHKAEIKNESAIQLMAWIATFRVSEAFGLEPSGPIPQTVTLDTIVRTAFIKDLDSISSNTNTMYSLVAQGDSVGKLILVFLLEASIAIAGVLRIFIILYLTGASFVILALRLLHKAPRTTDLIYGIVGNVLALLALHALTLFLVVVSVEWVANATNNIPGLVLDIVMIAFGILMCVFLFKLVKNLVKDAINLGGAKIKAGVHSIVGKLTNLISRATSINSLASQLESTDVNINADSIAEQAEQKQKELAAEHTRRNRESIERISNIVQEVETEEELKEESIQKSRIAKNSAIESAIASETGIDPNAIKGAATGVIDSITSGETSPELIQGAASVAASVYGGPIAGKAASTALNTELGQKIAEHTAESIDAAKPRFLRKKK